MLQKGLNTDDTNQSQFFSALEAAFKITELLALETQEGKQSYQRPDEHRIRTHSSRGQQPSKT